MRATLFVDASYHQSGAAGWGAWFKTDWLEKGLLFGGGFKTDMPSSNAAELCGIYNALLHVYTQVIPDDMELKKLSLQCDCVAALAAVVGAHPTVTFSHAPNVKKVHIGVRKGLRGIEYKAQKAIKELITKTHLQIDVRHVKGHSPGGSRSWVNRACDDIARRYSFQHSAGKGLSTP